MIQRFHYLLLYYLYTCINLVLEKWLNTYVTRGSAGLHNRGEHLLRCPPEEDGQVGTKVGSNRERNLYGCGELCVDVICCHSLPVGVFHTALVVPNHCCGQKNRAHLPGCVIAPTGSIGQKG
jgi:hypothetical protein